MGRHSTKLDIEASASSEGPPQLKRKRDEDQDHGREGSIEVDIDAPEPLSKKAMRKARRASKNVSVTVNRKDDQDQKDGTITDRQSVQQTEIPKDDSKRTAFGIWIGNLPWSANKPALIEFLTREERIAHDAISRVHMPAPSKSAKASNGHIATARNKGFAYVDFANQGSLDVALTLSNTFLAERRVLIKKSSDFEGRPDSTVEASKQNKTGNPPGNKVWIGNLGFEVNSEDLKTHFGQCGTISHLHVATFPESGRCKGFAWLEFEVLEAAEAAVRGYITVDHDKEDQVGDDEMGEAHTQAKKKRPRKWWVNKLLGRVLQVQFAESSSIRYKKRFGNAQNSTQPDGMESERVDKVRSSRLSPSRDQTDGRKRDPLRHIDSRNEKYSKAASTELRPQATIVEGRGKKVIFD